MENREREELEKEVQTVHSEKLDEPQIGIKVSDNNELLDEDLDHISGGLNSFSHAFEKKPRGTYTKIHF